MSRDFVVFGPADYKLVHSLPEWTVEGLLAEGNRVLVVDPMANLVSLVRTAAWQSRTVKRRFGLSRLSERLWHYAPPPVGLPGNSRVAAVARANARTLARLVARQVRAVGMTDPVLLSYLATIGPALARLPSSLVVFESGDADIALAGSAGQRAVWADLEAETCTLADLVFCVTEELCVPRRRYNARTYEVPCGVDPSFFGRACDPAVEVPADIAALPGPVLGYMGGLDPWKIDVPLLTGIARARPDWTIAMIGYRWFGFDTAPLEAVPNIHVLGPKPYNSFPSYLKGMDVGLLPFPLNEITLNGDALKAYEYLAAGLPVVGRAVPVARRLAPAVAIADTVEEFVAAIEAALAEGPEKVAERRAVAARHSWAIRTRVKLDHIERALGEKARRGVSPQPRARSAPVQRLSG